MFKKTKAAFTFLELLIAISLFAFGILSVLQIFPINRRYLNQSASFTQAAFLAQEEMESIRALTYPTITTGNFEPLHVVDNGTVDVFNQYKRQTTVTWIDSNSNWATAGSDTGLKRVDVTVTWNDRSINYSYLLTSYVYQ